MKEHVKFYADLLERTAWSFIAGFAGSYIAAGAVGSVQDLPISSRVAIGASAGIVSVLKGLAAVQLPWTASNSASVLPEKLDPPAPVPAPATPAKPVRKPRKRVARDDGYYVVSGTVVLVVLFLLLLLLVR